MELELKERIIDILRKSRGSLLSATTGYDILKSTDIGHSLPGLGHTKKECEDNIKDIEKILSELGIAKAEATKKAGIAEQQSISDIAQSERLTAEQQMEVVKVNEIKQAEINKARTIIIAEQDKKRIEIEAEASRFRVETEAFARLEAQRKEAEGVKMIGEAEAAVILAKGMSDAESKKAMELAGVTAQTTLAKEIGENKSYQDYLIKIKEVEVTQVVGVSQYESMAKAMNGADLKLLVNSGDVNSGMSKISDIFSAKGGSQLNGLLESLKQTDEGKSILSMLTKLAGVETVTKTDK